MAPPRATSPTASWCSNGHAVEADDGFCGECGAPAPGAAFSATARQHGGDNGWSSARGVHLPDGLPAWLRGSGSWSRPKVAGALVGGWLPLSFFLAFVFVPSVISFALAVCLLVFVLARAARPNMRTVVLVMALMPALYLVTDVVVLPLRDAALGYSPDLFVKLSSLPRSVGIAVVAGLIVTYFDPGLRRCATAWIAPAGFLVPRRSALSVAAVLLAGAATFSSLTGSTRVGFAHRFDASPTGGSVSSNYYDDGTVAGRMRTNVAAACSAQFGESLTVSVRQMRDTDNNWYFGLYSGQDGAGIALVNEGTGAIQCRPS